MSTSDMGVPLAEFGLEVKTDEPFGGRTGP